MNTCATCKHWTVVQERDDGSYENIYNPVDPDTWEPMDMPFEIRRCNNPAKTFCERPVERNGFGTADGSTYMADLFTGPDFGCVRHSDGQP